MSKPPVSLPEYLRNAPPLSADEIAEILSFIPRPPREEWIKLIAAAVAALGERDALPVLTAHFPDEKPNETAAVIRSLRGAPRSDAGTLVYYAQQNGFAASAFFKARAARLKEAAGATPAHGNARSEKTDTQHAPASARAETTAQEATPPASAPAASTRRQKTDTPRPPRNAGTPAAARDAQPLAPVRLGKCSMTASVRRPESVKETDLLAVLKALKAGKWRADVAAVRAGTRDKSTLPQCCAFGVYRERRADENLVSRSGFLVLDYDAKENTRLDFPRLKSRLAKLPFVAGVFVSPSGNGLKAVVRVPDAVSDADALAAAQIVLAPLGGRIDAQAAARKHFLISDDEGAFINPAPFEDIPPLAPFEKLSRDALAVIFADMIERFYFAGKETYYFDELDGLPFKELSKADAQEEFAEAYGLDRKTARRALAAVRKFRHVSAVFPALTCRARGIHQIGERRVLVLESTRPIYPEDGGAFPVWKKLFETVFDGEGEQMRRALAWLFFAVKRYHEAAESAGTRIQPVPALLLLGLSGSGKTLLAESFRILLGDRAAGNMKNFVLERPWLGDIIGNECVFGSEGRSLKPEERGALKSTMKEVLSGEGYFAESKNKAGFMFKAQHFLIHMANNEENGNCSASCPAIDEDFRDKFIALSTENVDGVKAAFPKDAETENRAALREQAPAFLHWLFTYYAETIPAEWQDKRFGLKHYEAPAATRALFEVSLAAEIDGKLREMLSGEFDTEWRNKKFTATAIAERIAKRFGGKPLYAGTLGKALNELCEKFPSLYIKAARNEYSFNRPREGAGDEIAGTTAEQGAQVSPFSGLPF